LVSQHAALHSAVLDEQFDIGAITRLRREKQELSREMNTLLQETVGRRFTAAETERWDLLHEHWLRISTELTARMEYLQGRQEEDRRQRERRRTQRRKQYRAVDVDDRRSDSDRRRREQRSGLDRRSPYRDVPPASQPPDDEGT
jgi:hypothetical protein